MTEQIDNLVWLTLKTLVSHSNAQDISVHDNVLYIDGKPAQRTGSPIHVDEFKARAEVLLPYLEIFDVSPAELAERWEPVLADGNTASREQLIDLARGDHSRAAAGADVLERWRQTILGRLHSSNKQLSFVERQEQDSSVADDKTIVDTSPLLTGWPERLLNETWWSTADSPIPGMKPLSLDDVWVDIRFIDPFDHPASSLDDLLAAMETRYGETGWVAESTGFVLDRLHDSTALIGAPGIGKTTFLKWLARRLLSSADGRYLLPLFVPLRQYVFKKRDAPRLDLVSFAVEYCGGNDTAATHQWKKLLKDLSGTSRQTVLFLLDGWDEVPLGRREELIHELQDLARHFTFLITSRPSAWPKHLPVERFYEIAELSPDAVPELIRRWFQATGNPEHAKTLVRHIDMSPDLRQLSRNPFLLTLLCGSALDRLGDSAISLPATRTELYEEAIRRIQDSHRQRFPSHELSEAVLRQVERFALWLIEVSPDGPQYVFDSGDVDAAGIDSEVWRTIVLRSRLLNQWSAANESLHFVHTGFHQYLAARGLLELPQDAATERVLAHAQNSDWQEVLLFAAGQSKASGAGFWDVMAVFKDKFDRFGLLAMRLARFAAEAEAIDGGQSLVHVDLRETLWSFVRIGTEASAYVDALIELDADWYVNRCVDSIGDSTPEQRVTLVRSLGRVFTSQSSQILVSSILADNKQISAVASYAIEQVLDEDSLEQLRQALDDTDHPDFVRRAVIRALGFSKDLETISLLDRHARAHPESRDQVLRSLMHIGGQPVCELLERWLIDADDAAFRGEIIDAIGNLREPRGRDTLIRQLSLMDRTDPEAEAILEALCEVPISNGSLLLTEFLRSSESESIRAVAAWALAEAGESHVTKSLADAAQHETSGTVRLAVLGALRRRARPVDASWLAACVENEGVELSERTRALEALIFCTERHAQQRDRRRLLRTVEKLIQLSLKSPTGDLAYTAATRAWRIGESVAPRLHEICADGAAQQMVREAACESLGKLKFQPAAETLQQLVVSAPNVGDDEEQAVTAADERLARAAAEALTRIDPEILLHIEGRTAEAALAHFAMKTGALVYADHIIDARGVLIAGSPPGIADCATGDVEKPIQGQPDSQPPGLAPEFNEPIFLREEKQWRLHFDGSTVYLKDQIKGLWYIRLLLQRPHKSFTVLHMIDLIEASGGGRSKSDDAMSQLEADGAKPEAELDDVAVSNLRRRLDEIKSDMADAKERGDIKQQEQLEIERTEIEDYVSQAFGPQGRRVIVDAELARARKSVRAAISRAIEKIQAEHPELARHFENAIRTGYSCSYHPEAETHWLT